MILALASPVYSSYRVSDHSVFGGSDWDSISAVDMNSNGLAAVCGNLGYDLLVRSYSPEGLTINWSHTYDTGGSDAGVDVVIDGQGNVFSGGQGGSNDAFVFKFDPFGIVVWTNRTENAVDQQVVFSLGLDVTSGDVIFSGFSAVNSPYHSPDFLLGQILPDGSHGWGPLVYGSQGLDFAFGCAVNPEHGCFYVVGSWSNSFLMQICSLTDGSVIDSKTSPYAEYGARVCLGPDRNIFVLLRNPDRLVKYSYNGDYFWSRALPWTPSDIDVDDRTNVYVVGTTNGTTKDVVVYKYDRWASLRERFVFDSGADDAGESIAVSRDGSHVVAGGSKDNGTDTDCLVVLFTNGPPAAPVLAGVPVLEAIRLSWIPVSGATSYTLFRAATNDPSHSVPVYNGGVFVSAWTDTGLSAGALYCYWVRAVNELGASAYSMVSSNRPLAVLATPPVLEPPTGISWDRMTIVWGPLSGATGYTLYRNTVNNPATALPIAVLAGDDAQYVDSGLSEDTTYYYWVRGFNPVSVSPASLAASGRTLQKREYGKAGIYPNSFKVSQGPVWIFCGEGNGSVRVRAYGITGVLMKDFGSHDSGEAFEWDGRFAEGKTAESGLYFLVFEGEKTIVVKFLIVD
jgi:hypothetical protein